MVFLCISAQMNSSSAASLTVGPSADPKEWGSPIIDSPTREGLELRGAGIFPWAQLQNTPQGCPLWNARCCLNFAIHKCLPGPAFAPSDPLLLRTAYKRSASEVGPGQLLGGSGHK